MKITLVHAQVLDQRLTASSNTGKRRTVNRCYLIPLVNASSKLTDDQGFHIITQRISTSKFVPVIR